MSSDKRTRLSTLPTTFAPRQQAVASTLSAGSSSAWRPRHCVETNLHTLRRRTDLIRWALPLPPEAATPLRSNRPSGEILGPGSQALAAAERSRTLSATCLRHRNQSLFQPSHPYQVQAAALSPNRKTCRSRLCQHLGHQRCHRHHLPAHITTADHFAQLWRSSPSSRVSLSRRPQQYPPQSEPHGRPLRHVASSYSEICLDCCFR